MEWGVEFVMAKAKEYGVMALQNMAVFMMGKADRECPAVGYVKEKANDVVMVLENLGVYHWLVMGSSYAIPCISMLWFWYGGGWKLEMMKNLSRFFFGGGWKVKMTNGLFSFFFGGKMMKAPGRDGLMIPRAPFEANPRAYFRDLRAR